MTTPDMTCPICDRPITEGETIIRSDELGGELVHARCLDCHDAGCCPQEEANG